MEVGIPDHIETEEEKKARLDEQYFKVKLSKIEEDQPEAFSKYHSLLLDEKIKLAKENGGKPVKISLEEREKILNRAEAVINFGADPVKMEHDWETFTSNDGRPPIGGAQDD
jgi:hypothetical protein